MGKNIIEFIGPPGVGKSSIYKALCQEWNSKHNWIYQDALLARKKPPLWHFADWLVYNCQLLLGRKLARDIPTDYALRFINNHQELAGLCWNVLCDPLYFNDQALDKRYRAAYLLLSDYCRYQAIWEQPDTRPCLIDEGFLQKSFLIHDDEQVMRELVKQYLALVPLPLAVVYIDTEDKHLITSRLQSRKKKLHPHLAQNEPALMAGITKWQYLLGMVVDTIRDEKVLIYQVDGARPIQENVKLIRHFLAGIR